MTYLAVTWIRYSMPAKFDIHDVCAVPFCSCIDVPVCIICQSIIPAFIIPRVKLCVIELVPGAETSVIQSVIPSVIPSVLFHGFKTD